MGSVLAAYGALLSTVLATLTIIKFLRERPRISVEAVLLSTSASEGDDTHGVLVHMKRGDNILWEEADVEVRVHNAGEKAYQISDVFVETSTTIQQVRPTGLPVVLDPRTAHSVRVQPEYFVPKKPNEAGELQTIPVVAIGVFDALGQKYRISKENLETLIGQCAGLPLRTAVYKHKETGNLIAAFQVKDAGTVVSKKLDSA